MLNYLVIGVIWLFGYVKPLPGELLLKEYELYKAVYCGLCHTGGKRISRFTRLFLSYDFTALAVLRLALQGEEPNTVKRFCPYALKRKKALDCDGVFTYVAAAFACLSYCKAADDVADEKGLKRLGRKTLMPLFKQMNKKSQKLYPGLYAPVKEQLEALYKLERDGERHSVDSYADPFATTLAHIAAHGLDGAKAAIAREAGYHIGRYIYIIDAIDDLAEDSKKGKFNPLISHFGSYEEAVQHMAELDFTLRASGVRFSAAVGLGEDSVYTDILQNIARHGMDSTVRDIYNKYAYTRKEIEQL